MSKYLSMRKGEIRDIDDSLAEKLIADGVAEQYNLVEPTGKITITENGSDIDVSQYAKADVTVNPNREVTVTGTLADPWGDLNFAELVEALDWSRQVDDIVDWNASAIIEANGGIKVHAALAVSNDNVSASATDGSFDVFYFEWDKTDGHLTSAKAMVSGTEVDISEAAPDYVTTLNVLYHPMPEA